ncbi:MAG: CDP-alcohol phosphatidyltransferase [Desulfobacterales bacterium]|nr:MAG: CDP-alcohol phosphatidyltransferase [Desulfobacterales bacterium]
MAALLVYGRPFLVFAGMLCAIGVMWSHSPLLYTLGVSMLFLSMSFDLVDGWFAARFQVHPTLAQLADRIMDKIVYSIIFPLVAVGMMWKLTSPSPLHGRGEILHAIFVMVICVAVLIRDNFAGFMRSFAIRQGREPEESEFTRLRTIFAAPVAALLYAHAFFIPEVPRWAAGSFLHSLIAPLGHLPLRGLFFIEICFFVITFGSIAAYCRKYGNMCLDELCLENERLRRSILSIFPNALTVMNAMMGLIAVFFAYQFRVREAFLLLIGAGIFDRLDGYVARKLGLTGPLSDEKETPRKINLGGILDDFADGVSFCIVPAWIFYILLSSVDLAGVQAIPYRTAAAIYAVAGIVRLIYFTLDKTPVPGFFKGLPTPAAAMAATAPLMLYQQAVNAGVPEGIRFWGWCCTGMLLLTSVLMNLYPVRYLHLGRAMGRSRCFARFNWLLLFAVVATPWLAQISLLYFFCYMLSPLFTWRIDPAVAERENREVHP